MVKPFRYLCLQITNWTGKSLPWSKFLLRQSNTFCPGPVLMRHYYFLIFTASTKAILTFQSLIRTNFFCMKKNFTYWFGALSLLFALPFVGQNLQAQGPCTAPIAGQIKIDICITTTSFAGESYWELCDSNGALVTSVPGGTYPTNGLTYGPTFIPQHCVCIDTNATYEFKAYDTFGDGWNGNTYEIKNGCDGSIIANNGGATPSNGQGGFIPNDLESTEAFSVAPVSGIDMTVEAVLSPNNNCEGDQDVWVIVCNAGGDDQWDFPVQFTIDTITLNDTISDTLTFCGACDTFLLGTVNLAGSTSGTGYAYSASVNQPGDGDTSNDTLSDSVFIYANTGGLQTRVFNPGLVMPQTGTVDVEFFVCNDFSFMDSCYIIDKVFLTDVDHDWGSELDISLISPSGTSVDLSSGNGGTGDDYNNVCLSDFAQLPITSQTFGFAPGTYLPEQSLSTFWGESAQGTWTLRFTDNGNFNIGTINEVGISFASLAVNSIGVTDTTYCGPGDYVINVANPNIATYMWDDGSTNPTQTVSEGGEETYTVSSTDIYGICTSSSSITVRKGYQVNIGPDMGLCSNETQTYALGNEYSAANWTGNGTQNGLNYTVDAVGTYIVEATDTFGCDTRDTALISTLFPAPVVDLGNDSINLCDGEFTVLDAGTGFLNYSWSPNAVGQTQIIVTSGNYSVVVTDGNGCTGNDNTEVIVHPLPTVPLPAPYFALPGTPASFSGGGNPTWTYFWQYNGTFSTLDNITFNVPLYGTVVTLQVTDEFGCSGVTTTYVFNYSLGIEEQEVGTVALFPNPNNGHFSLRNRGERQQLDLQLMDITGKVVYAQNNVVLENGVEFPIDLDGIAGGTYVLNMIHEDNVEQIKLIIE